LGSTSRLRSSSLNGTNGFVLQGEAQSDYSGFSVSSAGDINGDGLNDLLVGAPNADPNGSSSGKTYVVFSDIDNKPPVITPGQTFSVPENSANGTTVGTIQATDEGQTLTYQITGNSDTDSDGTAGFAINSSQGVITVQDLDELDFENKPQQRTLTVQVTDNGVTPLSDTKTVTVNVTNVNEVATAITLNNNTIEENKPKGTLVGVLDNNDPDTGDTQTYRLVYKNPFFQINGDKLETKLPITYYENEDNSFDLAIEVKDQTGATYQEWFTVNVLPTFQNSAPTDIILSNNSIEENQPVATAVGNLTTNDPDSGQTHTYQILTPSVPFIIENGTLKTTALLDYETQTSYDLEIETNDGNGGTYKETLTIQVNNISDPATINLTPTELKVVEGLNNAVFDITVKGASEPVSVQYRTEDRTAIAGTDYTAKTETLTFDTDGTKQITIPILNNNESEPDKTFKVLAGTSTPLSDQEATVTVTDTQETAATSTLPGKVENLLLTETGNINGTGNTGNNILTGNSGNNTLSGGGGNDTLTGNEGNDILNGGTGADSLTGGEGNDTYYVDNVGDKATENSNEGTDRVISSLEYTLEEEGNVENLTLNGSKPINGTGNSQNNIIIGNNLNNTLTGLGGSDALDGKKGADTLEGGSGNDTYHVDNSEDKVIEKSAEGTDRVFSYLSEYILLDNVENLYLQDEVDGKGTGNASNNTIVGDSSDNELIGGAGNDFLTGGTGNDILTGEIGSEIFYFHSPEEGVDTITDFSNTGKIKDKLYLNATGFGLEKGTLTSDQFFLGSAATEDTHRFIYDNGALFYDEDGNGAGTQVKLATLTGAIALGVSDIVLF